MEDPELTQVLFRIRVQVNDALEVMKKRTRISKSVIAENAIREYLEKHNIEVKGLD